MRARKRIICPGAMRGSTELLAKRYGWLQAIFNKAMLLA